MLQVKEKSGMQFQPGDHQFIKKIERYREDKYIGEDAVPCSRVILKPCIASQYFTNVL